MTNDQDPKWWRTLDAGRLAKICNMRTVSYRESQRDSASKPRVARHELPWVNVVKLRSTLKGLRPPFPFWTSAAVRHPITATTPLGLINFYRLPRVARVPVFASLRRVHAQPWAGGRNPFGIGSRGDRMMVAVGFNPRWTDFKICRVAERRLKRAFLRASVMQRRPAFNRRYATETYFWHSQPWVKTHGYRQWSLRDPNNPFGIGETNLTDLL
jgi:hypothetical protein